MKKSTIIISIIIVLALIGGGVFWYVKQGEKEINPPVVENNNLEEEQKGNELQGEEIDTSDWLTYRNEEYGFEVRYPQDWRIEKNDQKLTFIDPDNYDDFYKWTEMEIGFWNNVDNLEERILEPFKKKYGYKTMQEFVEGEIDVFAYSVKNINDIDIPVLTMGAYIANDYYYISSLTKEKSYIIVTLGMSVYTDSAIENLILSTIKLY